MLAKQSEPGTNRKGPTLDKPWHDRLIPVPPPAHRIRERAIVSTDPLGRVSGITDLNRNNTGYGYDDDGRLIKVTSPDGGVTRLGYDPLGRLAKLSHDQAGAKSFGYDALGRIRSICHADPRLNVYYDYQGDSRIPCRIRDASGEYNQKRDQRGRLNQERASILGHSYKTGYTYDSKGNLVSLSYPTGLTLRYERDLNGRISAITTGKGETIVKKVTYTKKGRINSYVQGNGLKTIFGYDDFGRLVSRQVGRVCLESLDRDAAGRVIRILDRIDPQKSQWFEYDMKGRLCRAKGPYGDLAYSYDANGNRLTKTAGAKTSRYAYKPGCNQLTGVSGAEFCRFEYDPAGGAAELGDMQAAYGADLRLKRVRGHDGATVRYVYDASGRRRCKRVPGSTIVYHYCNMGRLIAETDQYGGFIRHYIWLDGGPGDPTGGHLIGVGELGGMYYAHQNHRGETHLATDADGEVVWRNLSTPFGSARIDGGGPRRPAITLNLRLPGQYFDAETGLHHNHHREYSPGLGRYIQADPIGLNGGMNPYVYCGNDPVNKCDVWGLWETEFDGATLDDDDPYGGDASGMGPG
jgi:RHS repeat-associated protein